MKMTMTAVLMACAVSVSAGEVTADSNLAIGANTILAKFTRLTEVPAGDIPNVDKSLAIGARSIFGIFPRQTEVAPGNIPNVDAARDGFIQGVMSRQADYRLSNPVTHAASGQASVVN
ncbi:MAG: hypothetical protein ACTS9Y_02545 [Methylophilus sp.]|uniref:hypothetical protein n=1 Tax=Methylophilus sp. TaxID=29541 RepID=UPI003FA1258F